MWKLLKFGQVAMEEALLMHPCPHSIQKSRRCEEAYPFGGYLEIASLIEASLLLEGPTFAREQTFKHVYWSFALFE